MLTATWENVREHAAGPLDYWGSRGRGFKSRRPDRIKAVTSGAWPGLAPVDGDLNRPEYPTKPGSATRFVIHAKYYHHLALTHPACGSAEHETNRRYTTAT